MRNRVKNLLNKILINAGDENGRVVIFDPNFEAEINFRSVFFNKTHGVSNATGNTLIPVLNIPDFELFVDSMTDYLTEAIPFYKNDFLGLDPRYLAEKLIYDVLGSATPADFANMVPYLKHRTNMLKNKFKKQIFHWGKYKEFKFLGSIEEAGSQYEAPYKFLAAFDDESGARFKLPAVLFGVDGDKVYIYAIQNTAIKQTEESIRKNQDITKKLNRYFRKVNLNVDEQDIIANVSPNFLVVLTIFTSYMRQLGKKELVAPLYFPVRYDSNLDYHMRLMPEGETAQSIQEKHDHNYLNTVNKFAYLFLRYSYHFPETQAEYDENSSRITAQLKKCTPKDSNIIYEIDNLVPVQNKKEMQ